MLCSELTEELNITGSKFLYLLMFIAGPVLHRKACSSEMLIY